MGKRIGFAGVACEDIMLHIAKSLRAFGKHVKLADVSGTGYLKNAYGGIERKDLEADGDPLFLGETAVVNTVFFPSASDDETVLCYLGFRECIYEELDSLVIVTDRMPVNARRLKDLLGAGTAMRAFVVIRDTFVQEYDDSYILYLMGREKNEYASVPFCDEDMRVRGRIQNGLPYRLSGLSAEMTDTVKSVLEYCGEGNEAMFRDAVRKERNGRWGRLWSFGHRYREAVV